MRNPEAVFGDSDGMREREMAKRKDDKRIGWRDSEKAVRNASAESTLLWSASARLCYFFFEWLRRRTQPEGSRRHTTYARPSKTNTF